MPEDIISGQIINSYNDYVRKKFGKDGIAEMSKALGTDMGAIKDEKTYPATLAFNAMEYLKEKYGLEEIYKLGRFTVSNVGAKRYFTMFISTDKILPRMVESVQKVNNTIMLSAEYDKNTAKVTVSAPLLQEVQREFWRGMMQGTFDLNKTKGKIEVDDSKMSTHGMIIYKLSW